MVLLQFEPADGRVVEHTVPRWRVVRTCFLVYMCTHVNSVYPTFRSEMHIRGTNIFPGSITSL